VCPSRMSSQRVAQGEQPVRGAKRGAKGGKTANNMATLHRLHYNTPTHCPHCDGLGHDETAEHALLDCPAYADLRAEPRFAPLFANLPALARMHQHKLGAFVHACFERRTVAT
jgi:hypothetical protein